MVYAWDILLFEPSFLGLLPLVRFWPSPCYLGFPFGVLGRSCQHCSCLFFYIRYLFPYYVVYQGVYLGYGGQCALPGIEGRFERCRSAGTCLSSTILLSLLACLHIYWFCLLLRIALKLVFTNESGSSIGAKEYEGPSSATEIEFKGKKKKSWMDPKGFVWTGCSGESYCGCVAESCSSARLAALYM